MDVLRKFHKYIDKIKTFHEEYFSRLKLILETSDRDRLMILDGLFSKLPDFRFQLNERIELIESKIMEDTQGSIGFAERTVIMGQTIEILYRIDNLICKLDQTMEMDPDRLGSVASKSFIGETITEFNKLMAKWLSIDNIRDPKNSKLVSFMLEIIFGVNYDEESIDVAHNTMYRLERSYRFYALILQYILIARPVLTNKILSIVEELKSKALVGDVINNIPSVHKYGMVPMTAFASLKETLSEYIQISDRQIKNLADAHKFFETLVAGEDRCIVVRYKLGTNAVYSLEPITIPRFAEKYNIGPNTGVNKNLIDRFRHIHVKEPEGPIHVQTKIYGSKTASRVIYLDTYDFKQWRLLRRIPAAYTRGIFSERMSGRMLVINKRSNKAFSDKFTAISIAPKDLSFDNTILKSTILDKIRNHWKKNIQKEVKMTTSIKNVNKAVMGFATDTQIPIITGDEIMCFQRSNINVAPKFYAEAMSSYMAEFNAIMRSIGKNLYDMYRDKPYSASWKVNIEKPDGKYGPPSAPTPPLSLDKRHQEILDFLMDIYGKVIEPVLGPRSNIYERLSTSLARMKDFT
jgi:hypothetical protein